MKNVQLSCHLLLCRLPVCAQFLVEFLPAFLGEENSGTLKLDALPSAGDVVSQPARPSHVEIDIVRSPDDQRRCLQCPQPVFDGKRMLIVESCEEPLQAPTALLAPAKRTSASFVRVVP